MTIYAGTAYPAPPASSFASGGGPCGSSSSPTYEMRGKVAGNFVYWPAVGIDSTGAQYTGGGGPPTDIVVIPKICVLP